MWVHGVGLDLSPLTPHPHPSPFTSQASHFTPHLSLLTSHPHLSFLTRHLSPSPLISHLSPITFHLSPLTPPYAQQNGFLASLQSAKLHLPLSLYTCSPSALRIYVASFPLFRFLLRCHLFRGKASFNPLHPLHLLAWSLFTALVHHYRAHACPCFPT